MTTTATLPDFTDDYKNSYGAMIQSRVIGTYHHKDSEREFTQHYECAAWHRSGKFPEGEYPIVEYKGITPGQSVVFVNLSGGVITSACLVSRIGACYGADRGNEEIGKPFKYRVRVGAYSVAQMIDEGHEFHEAIELVDVGDNFTRAIDPETGKRIGS